MQTPSFRHGALSHGSVVVVVAVVADVVESVVVVLMEVDVVVVVAVAVVAVAVVADADLEVAGAVVVVDVQLATTPHMTGQCSRAKPPCRVWLQSCFRIRVPHPLASDQP